MVGVVVVVVVSVVGLVVVSRFSNDVYNIMVSRPSLAAE